MRNRSGIVRDAPIPAEPSWWQVHNKELVSSAWVLVPLGAGVAAFLAAWREAWAWAGEPDNPVIYWRRFVWWLMVRFVGYGACVFLAPVAILLGFYLLVLLL